jgi:hypothetical protein
MTKKLYCLIINDLKNNHLIKSQFIMLNKITNATFDYSFGVSSSSDCISFNTVKCTSQESNGDRAYAFNAQAGTDYYFFIGDGDTGGTDAGTFDIALSCAPTPSNNQCSTATALSCGSLMSSSWPIQPCQSLRHSPVAFTFMIAPCGAGLGMGRSCTTIGPWNVS